MWTLLCGEGEGDGSCHSVGDDGCSEWVSTDCVGAAYVFTDAFLSSLWQEINLVDLMGIF